ncbi:MULTISPECIES: hypothetical protein [unclassified Haladaptatus]|uniref:hypothetical protein n=1 Tax=unclassified Haladaptatus TaxID=2622732 RepID=UPI0023E8B1BD|nr:MULTISPECIES: hypothetical protein [unclassified Haladaptatus]
MMTKKTRRRFLQVTGSAIAVGLAGCSSNGSDDTTTTGETTTAGETTTSDGGMTTTENGTTTTETDLEGASPGPEDGDHWHGAMYLEIDGERMNLSTEKFVDDENLEPFHFHTEKNNNNKWHLSEEAVTLGQGLNQVPNISYQKVGSNSKLTIDGETYDSSKFNTNIAFQQRDVTIDPTQYKVKDGDIFWVMISTDGSEPTPNLDGGVEETTTSGNSTETATSTSTGTSTETTTSN